MRVRFWPKKVQSVQILDEYQSSIGANIMHISIGKCEIVTDSVDAVSVNIPSSMGLYFQLKYKM